MPFELPENLHPNCGPIAWLLGTWQGNGHGDYPTIEKFSYGQELLFTHDGRPFFHYIGRSWITDENGEKVRDAAIETGFIRCPEPGRIEWLMTHISGISELWVGEAGEGRIELVTDAVMRTESAKEVVGGKRMYGNVNGDLMYAYDMAAMGQALQPHLWAQLKRV